MKFVFNLFIFFLLTFQLLLAKEDLCKECSQNLGTGFYFDKPDPTKGIQLVSSSIGLISSEPQMASDGTVLISGYMPVCVVPMLGLGPSDTLLCSGKDIFLTSNAFLIDNINWEVPNLNFSKLGTFEDTIKINQIVNKIEIFKMKVESEKGGIKSISDSLNVIIYPRISPLISNNFKIGNDTNIVCNFKDITVAITDNYYSLDSLDIIWDDGTIGSTNIIDIQDQVISKTLTLKNKNNSNLCDTSFVLHFKPLKPSANISIKPKDEKNSLNPADYENIDNPFYFEIGLEGNNDYIAALNVCPPSYYEADISIPKRMLYPIDEFSLISEDDSFKNLRYIGSLNNYKPEDKIYKINVIPILVDQTQGEIVVNKLQLKDEEQNNNIYNVQSPKSFSFTINVCSEYQNQKRLLSNYFSNFVNLFYPNPANTILNIELNRLLIQGDNISIQIFNNNGLPVYNYIINKDKKTDKIVLELPSLLSSGIYKTIITDGFNYDNFEFIILR